MTHVTRIDRLLILTNNKYFNANFQDVILFVNCLKKVGKWLNSN